jgi:hypothetical protein
MTYGINMTRANVERINRFLKVAARDGFGHAMQQHSDLMSIEESAALKTLEPDEIRAMLEISENVLRYRDEEGETSLTP